MSYTVVLRKPGRLDTLYPLPYLGARIERVVDRYSRTDSVDAWRTLSCYYDPSIFIETYRPTTLEGMQVVAEFVSMRRSHELPRHFDPARLP